MYWCSLWSNNAYGYENCLMHCLKHYVRCNHFDYLSPLHVCQILARFGHAMGVWIGTSNGGRRHFTHLRMQGRILAEHSLAQILRLAQCSCVGLVPWFRIPIEDVDEITDPVRSSVVQCESVTYYMASCPAFSSSVDRPGWASESPQRVGVLCTNLVGPMRGPLRCIQSTFCKTQT